MKSRTEIITPERASELLEGNTGNRPLSSMTVKTIAREMIAGKWMLSHQGIAIDKSGRLIDGQHRLHAVIMSGISVPMMVTTGCNPATFLVLDVARRRSGGDVCSMDGHKNAHTVSALSAGLIFSPGASKATLGQISRISEEYRESLAYFSAMRQSGKFIMRAINTSPFFIDDVINGDDIARRSIKELISDEPCDGGLSEFRAIRKWLFEVRAKRIINKSDEFYVIASALGRVRSGKRPRKRVSKSAFHPFKIPGREAIIERFS